MRAISLLHISCCALSQKMAGLGRLTATSRGGAPGTAVYLRRVGRAGVGVGMG
jgi:hypothetical protein